ncbi:MAG: hypothetical protein ACX932_04515 [Gammaproteobacteria bacterium]
MTKHWYDMTAIEYAYNRKRLNSSMTHRVMEGWIDNEKLDLKKDSITFKQVHAWLTTYQAILQAILKEQANEQANEALVKELDILLEKIDNAVTNDWTFATFYSGKNNKDDAITVSVYHYSQDAVPENSISTIPLTLVETDKVIRYLRQVEKNLEEEEKKYLDPIFRESAAVFPAMVTQTNNSIFTKILRALKVTEYYHSVFVTKDNNYSSAVVHDPKNHSRYSYIDLLNGEGGIIVEDPMALQPNNNTWMCGQITAFSVADYISQQFTGVDKQSYTRKEVLQKIEKTAEVAKATDGKEHPPAQLSFLTGLMDTFAINFWETGLLNAIKESIIELKYVIKNRYHQKSKNSKKKKDNFENVIQMDDVEDSVFGEEESDLVSSNNDNANETSLISTNDVVPLDDVKDFVLVNEEENDFVSLNNANANETSSTSTNDIVSLNDVKDFFLVNEKENDFVSPNNDNANETSLTSANDVIPCPVFESEDRHCFFRSKPATEEDVEKENNKYSNPSPTGKSNG